MPRKLEDIFNECYERIRAGESLQSCLARYPEYRNQLKPMLETAFDIGRRASYIHPRPEFKHWTQVRLQGAQHYHANQQSRIEPPSRFGLSRQVWAMAATAVVVMLVTTGSTIAASQNAMPDQKTLYPIKLATEDMRRAFATTDAQKFQLIIDIAETRKTEIEVMSDEGKPEDAYVAAQGFAKQLEEADALLARIEADIAKAQKPTSEPTPPIVEPPVVEPPVVEPPVAELPIVEPPIVEPPVVEPPVVEPPVVEPPVVEPPIVEPPVVEPPIQPQTVADNTTPPATGEQAKWAAWRAYWENKKEEWQKDIVIANDENRDGRKPSNHNNHSQTDNTTGQGVITDNSIPQTDNTTGQGGITDNTSTNQYQPPSRDRNHRR